MSSDNKDYYEILQIHPSAEPEVIAAVYKRLMQKYHPDKNPDNPAEAERRAREFIEAYAVLGKPDRRAAYDRERAFGSNGYGARWEEDWDRREEPEPAPRREEADTPSWWWEETAAASSPSDAPEMDDMDMEARQRETAARLGLSVFFRDRVRSGGKGPELAVIPPGAFTMGSPGLEPEREPREGPLHHVTFTRPFAIGRFAVTFDEYDRFCEATGRRKPDDRGWGRGRRPVIDVDWHDAEAYCEWLSRPEQTGQRYRLPSEAEWEYACRAGTATAFWWGSTIAVTQANYDGNYIYNGGTEGKYRKKTVPVDEFQPNPFGLYQMHGNVWEWCGDAWHGDYWGAPADGSAWEHGGSQGSCMARGGSWGNFPAGLRSASRVWYAATFRDDHLGFRLVQDISL
jgi:formylglycine-generating enzyme required for sulfatase activity